MKKVTTVELIKDGVSIGHSPVIKEGGKKPKMFIEDGEAVVFETVKEAKEYGKENM